MKDGEFLRGVLFLKTIERANYNPDGSKSPQRFDSPIIISHDPAIIRKMTQIKVLDMVDIHGVLCTIQTKKKNRCKICHEINETIGTLVYVAPLYLEKRYDKRMEECDERNDMREKAEIGLELLKERAEISNHVRLVGNLCDDPSFFNEPGIPCNAAYMIAVNRKIKISGQSEDITCDFPWIKTFGNMAAEDYESLQKGSIVFVHGMIRTRKPPRVFECQHCGSSYTCEDSVTDIVPYSVEYFGNLKETEPMIDLHLELSGGDDYGEE